MEEQSRIAVLEEAARNLKERVDSIHLMVESIQTNELAHIREDLDKLKFWLVGMLAGVVVNLIMLMLKR